MNGDLLSRREFLGAVGLGATALALPGFGGGLRTSSGEYQGRKWHIDENHLMWWAAKPYVRFGFTGNGDLAQMLKAGFDQFTLMPSEQWPITGPDPEIVRSVNEMSDQLEKAGATYYGTLNAFWPWRYGNLIAESDKAAVFIRDVRDVTERSAQHLALDLQVHLPIGPVERDKVKPEQTHAVLFDMEHGKRYDVSDKVESVVPITIPESGSEARDRGEDEGQGEKVFPESTSVRLVIAMEVRLAGLPGVHGLPALWKPGIREFYQHSIEAFRSAYAKPGLRGLLFGDEINTFPLSLLAARTYLDIRRDEVALKAYHDWLAQRFGDIKELNRQFGTHHASFDQVQWQVPLHPFDPELARSDDAAEREESWAGRLALWPLAGPVREAGKRDDKKRAAFCLLGRHFG